MVFSVANDREQPHATLVSEYSVYRLGADPVIRLQYAEVRRDSAPLVVIAEMLDEDEDGSFESLIIPDYDLRADVVGKELRLEDGTSIGKVTSVLEGSLMEVTGAESIVIPTRYILQTGTLENYTGAKIYFELINQFGNPVYRPAIAGRRWETVISTTDQNAMPVLNGLMGNSLFNAVKAVLLKVGSNNISDSQIFTAIHALGMEGISIDSFITEQAEILEAERQAGQHKWVIPMGTPPRSV